MRMLLGSVVVTLLFVVPTMVAMATQTGTANANALVGAAGPWTTEPYVPIPATPGQQVALTPMQKVFVQTPAGGFPDAFTDPGIPLQCTYWAAYNRYVPWGGDAITWINNARARGVPITSTPQVGDIVVFNGGTFHYPGMGGYFAYDTVHGHVAVVVAVTSTSYTVQEMNNPAFSTSNGYPPGTPDSRTIPYQPTVPNGDPAVLGYIPPPAPPSTPTPAATPTPVGG